MIFKTVTNVTLDTFTPTTPLQAYIKALGVGLDYDLSRIEVRLTTGRPRVLVDGHPLHQWTFDLHVVDPEHLMAVAEGPPAGDWSTPVTAPSFVRLSVDEVTRGACPFQFRQLDADARPMSVTDKTHSECSQVRDTRDYWGNFLDIIQCNWFR